MMPEPGRLRQSTAMLTTVFVVLSSAIQAQAPISCEAWLEVHKQSGKLATELNTWMVLKFEA